MRDFYVVFLDIDGTVYCGGKICRENREAIALAQAAGHKVCINTARSTANIPSAVLAVDWDAVVAGLGCTVRIREKTLLSAHIPTDSLAPCLDELTDAGFEVMLEGEDALYCNRLFPDKDNCIVLEDGEQLRRRFGATVPAKVFIAGVLPEEMQRRFATQFQFYQHRNYAEFAVKGHNKATGMRCVLDAFGRDVPHCIAMGDSVNDLDMLRFAGISVAMGDADERVKEICTYKSCPAADGGVAKALRELLDL